jgi:hypothetical protein
LLVADEAARALVRGDALRALGLVGRDESARGLTLRGIAYAQLGDLELARQSLERAQGLASDPLGRARTRAALVEIALAAGDPAPAARAARESAEELERLGDLRNAVMQWLVAARAEVLLGQLGEARRVVEAALARPLDADVRAVALLASAEIAMRAALATAARDALGGARRALEDAPNELLARAIVALERELTKPIARLSHRGATREADLFAVEAASAGDWLLVDACRRIAIGGRATISFSKRPLLFALLHALARAWPDSVPRDELAGSVFESRRVNPSHRSRLRVEIGRLRKAISGVAEPVATADGYTLATERDVVILVTGLEDDAAADEDARIALLLGDGARWSAQALAEHAGVSKRTVQRALAPLIESGVVVRTGKGRESRYERAGAPIASRSLLLGLLPKS